MGMSGGSGATAVSGSVSGGGAAASAGVSGGGGAAAAAGVSGGGGAAVSAGVSGGGGAAAESAPRPVKVARQMPAGVFAWLEKPRAVPFLQERLHAARINDVNIPQ